MKKKEIKKIIDSKDTVSFDIFDTLLLRNIYKPTDIFKILEKEVLEKYDIKDFFTIRINCEANSRTEKNNNETSLDEIYELIENKTKEKMDYVKKREIELELEFITANPFMKEIFEYAKIQNKNIILISDMYLPKDIVRKLLKKADYDDVPLYISCEYHANKGTTELYDLVCKKEKLNKNKWVHIGDNKYSDYEQAKKFGIDAILYDKVNTKDKLKEPKTIESSIIRGIQNNYVYNGKELSYWEKFGVLYASPIYFGFTNWLFKLTKNEDNLFFLARDGYIIKKIYDMFLNYEKSDIKTYYLYCSRKTFQLPALLDKSKDELINFLVPFIDDVEFNVSIADILKSLNLDFKNYKYELSIFGFENENEIITKNNHYQAKKFFKYIYSDIEIDIINNRNKVIKYLKQEKVYDYEKINIMDIGWGGSAQEAMNIFTGKEIMGYYLGTIPTHKKDILCNSLGFAFDEAKPNKYYKKIFHMPMMYELIFSAPEGTTLNFKQEDNKIIPILDNYDEDNIKIVNILQNSAISIIKTYISFSKYLNNFSAEDSIFNYDTLISRRNFEDLYEFSKLTNTTLYTNNKIRFVKFFDEEWIYKNYKKFLEETHKSLWRDSYLINDIKTQKEWDEYKIRFNKFVKERKAKSKKRKKNKSQKKKAPKKTKTQYIIKGIKNPKKAARAIRKRIIK